MCLDFFLPNASAGIPVIRHLQQQSFINHVMHENHPGMRRPGRPGGLFAPQGTAGFRREAARQEIVNG